MNLRGCGVACAAGDAWRYAASYVFASLRGGKSNLSVEMVVFLRAERMLTAQQWQAAIRAHGFDLELDTGVDIGTLDGYLPCHYKGVECGFEYSKVRVADSAPQQDVLERVGDRDEAVSFITRADFRDLMASVIASAALCAATGGVLFDTEGDSFIESAGAVSWARSGEVDIAQDL